MANKTEQYCCICGKKIENYGNNAEPVADGRCCDDCNRLVVIPARVRQLRESGYEI